MLIAGGRDKGQDFGPPPSWRARHVRQVILIGEGAAAIAAAWKGVPQPRAGTLAEAVRQAFEAARCARGATVLLSPGCASFDMFRDYEDRGARFKEEVERLASQGGARVNRGDRWLIVLPLALTAVGVVMVYSSSAILGITRYQDPNYFLSRQLFRAGLGVVVLLAAAKLDLRAPRDATPWLLAVSLGLLVLAVAAGHVSHGASRWLRLGFLTLQPTDAGRLAAVLFLAWWLKRHPPATLGFWRGLVPSLALRRAGDGADPAAAESEQRRAARHHRLPDDLPGRRAAHATWWRRSRPGRSRWCSRCARIRT